MKPSTPLPTDPDARKTDVAEIVRITGWTEAMVTRAIRTRAIPGCRYIPGEGVQGKYLCAFKPFARWWFDGVETAPAVPDQSESFVRRVQLFDTVKTLIESELDPTG